MLGALFLVGALVGAVVGLVLVFVVLGMWDRVIVATCRATRWDG